MRREGERDRRLATRPVVVGTGLVALDAVYTPAWTGPRLWAGGTCGNVLTILAYLDWLAYPVARLDTDPNSAEACADMERWGVRLDHARLEPRAMVPMIVETIRSGRDGEAQHRFSLTCPDCGRWLPTYKPVTRTAVADHIAAFPRADVFFFDRVSRAAIMLAEEQAKRGALVFFEPSGVGDRKLFREALQLAHVVKYSHERIRDLADLRRERPPLEVVTQGADGLKFRRGKATKWIELPAFDVPVVRDTAGCGDWCTAGFIYQLGTKGVEAPDEEELRAALLFGQALAAWNCGFEGARGGMYQVDRRDLLRHVESMVQGEMALSASPPTTSGPTNGTTFSCPNCLVPTPTGARRRSVRGTARPGV